MSVTNDTPHYMRVIVSGGVKVIQMWCAKTRHDSFPERKPLDEIVSNFQEGDGGGLRVRRNRK